MSTDPRVHIADPDFRRVSKTDRYCWLCQRDLASGSGRHAFTNGYDGLVHPDDATADNSEPVLIGPECARRVPPDYTTSIDLHP